jgi:epoxyqueuosine reductase
MGREATEAIRGAGLDLGFSLVGFAPAGEPVGSRRLLDWLDLGYEGPMAWMARDPRGRFDPERFLPGVRTVVVVALGYKHPPPPPVPAAPRISCYAWGDDYHAVMSRRLHGFETRIRAILGEPVQTRVACDTSPVMDKAWAGAGGIGWLGKNACLIHPREGSWLFLGEIFLDRELPPDARLPDRCGDCRRCLDACPTGALAAPYLLDARRCISSLTIEHRAEFTASEQAALGDWLAGCDICQEVCPWNRRAPVSTDEALAPRPALLNRSAAEWAGLDDASCRELLRGTALTRIKPAMMRRNAAAVLENRRTKE